MTISRRDNVKLALDHKETLWIPNNITDCDIVLQSAVLERYEGRESGFDEFGVEYIFNEKANGPVNKPDVKRLSSISKWKEDLIFPDIKNRDWDAACARDTAGWDRENKFSIVQMFNGMFERTHMLLGFEDALMALLKAPEAMSEFFEAFVDYRIELTQHIAKYYKPDAVMIFDDYGIGNSMMMSQKTWRKLIKPQLKRLVDATHDCGLYYILHSCGYIQPIFSDFIELGVDGIHPVQVANGVPELKKQFGDKICFCGGFDNVGVLDREDATEEDVRNEVRRVIREVAPGGSFIAWKSYFSGERTWAYLDEFMKVIIPQMEAAGVAEPEINAVLKAIKK